MYMCNLSALHAAQMSMFPAVLGMVGCLTQSKPPANKHQVLVQARVLAVHNLHLRLQARMREESSLAPQLTRSEVFDELHAMKNLMKCMV